MFSNVIWNYCIFNGIKNAVFNWADIDETIKDSGSLIMFQRAESYFKPLTWVLRQCRLALKGQ